MMLLAREFHAARCDHLQHVSGNAISTDCLEQLAAFSQESIVNKQKTIAMLRDYFHRARNYPGIQNHASYIHKALQGLQGIQPGKGRRGWPGQGP